MDRTTGGAGGTQGLVSTFVAANGGIMVRKTGTHVIQVYGGSAANEVNFSSTGKVFNSQWYHIALIRKSGIFKLYINGINDGSQTVSANIPQQILTMGDDGQLSGYLMNGFIDEVRIIKGAAAWTTNFTLPTSEYLAPSSYLIPQWTTP